MSDVRNVEPPVHLNTSFDAGWRRWLYRLWSRGPQIFKVSLTPASIGPTTTSEQTFTITKLGQPRAVLVNKPTHQTGLGVVGVRVSAKDQIAISYVNVTGAPITPTAEDYTIVSIY